MLTFLPMDEVNRLSALKEGLKSNHAKEVLAYELLDWFTASETKKDS